MTRRKVAHIFRFNEEGLMAERWGLFDLAGKMRQLS